MIVPNKAVAYAKAAKFVLLTVHSQHNDYHSSNWQLLTEPHLILIRIFS